MHLPLVPLPNFLHSLGNLHSISAYVLGGLFTFAGVLFVLSALEPGLRSSSGRRYAREGFVFLGIALLGGLFGLYTAIILVVGAVAFIVWALIQGAVLAFGRID